MLLKLLNVLIATILLCQCTTTSNMPESLPVVKQKAVNPYPLPAADYLAQAKLQQGEQKQKSLLLAAGSMINAGHAQQGAAILAQTAVLNAVQEHEKNLLSAQVAWLQHKPSQTLAKLDALKSAKGLTPYQQIQEHQLRAQASEATHQAAAAVLARIELDKLLVEQKKQRQNQRALWLSLLHLPQDQQSLLMAEAEHYPELQGWLHLAEIARQHRQDSSALYKAVQQWQSQYKTHSANHLLPNPLESAEKMLSSPQHIALLVPLTGPLAGPGNAIRSGFIAAASASSIKVYDTNKKEVKAVYEQAVADGAEYVVGPLLKNEVAAVVDLPHPVPTVFLNEGKNDKANNSYFFGLSSAHEAQQTAIRAYKKGHQRALIIAPKNEWGKELTTVFSHQWQQQKGQVVDTLWYGPQEDLSKKIKEGLHVVGSEAREKQMKALLGYNIEVAVNRRQDFDMVFLLAYPSKARQIMPLLNYYYAGTVPVYATSSAYAGSANALKDKDLDGLIFCDIPWVFDHQMGNKNWPEQLNSYNRLYALGQDSYTFAARLNHLLLFSTDERGDNALFLNKTHVTRLLEWGQFKQGLAHSLGSDVI